MSPGEMFASSTDGSQLTVTVEGRHYSVFFPGQTGDEFTGKIGVFDFNGGASRMPSPSSNRGLGHPGVGEHHP